MPDRNPVDADMTAALNGDVRRLVFERTYLIFYLVDESRQQVTVVAFRHGARRGPGDS